MLRAFLVILAIVIAVLAIVFDRPWLYAGAIVPLLGVLGLLGWRLWETYRSQSRTGRKGSSDLSARGDSLEDFGIVDVRPQRSEDGKATQNEDEEKQTASSTPTAAVSEEESDEAAYSSAKGEGTPVTSDGKSGESNENRTSADAPEGSEEEAVLVPLMESLRSALDAETVCLLLQEEVLLTYRIEALSSEHPAGVPGESFDSQVPLLTAGMSRQSVTIRELSTSEVTREDLNYYEHPPEIEQIAVVPVPRPDEPVSYFLLADASVGADLGSSRARALLDHFAETAALLLDSESSLPQEVGKTTAENPSNGQASTSSSGRESVPSDGGEVQPRPRREIIAEEMKAADAASEELSLILVHLNRAESIARRGEAAVSSAERLLRARLEQLAPNQRVERFGELTYGIFFRGGVDAVEPWAADLQEVMAAESGELEGGVSVGVAVWGPRHDAPEALRKDATEALWEAYETGTCTIVA